MRVGNVFMDGYVEQWGKRYHYDNIYSPMLELSKIKLKQAGEIIAGDGYEIAEHIQVCNEISYVVTGSCEFYVNGKKFHANEGDLQLVTTGMKHRIVANKQDNLRMAYIGFVFRDNTEEIKQMKDFYQNPPQLIQNDRYLSRTLYEQLLYEIYSTQIYSKEAMDACINQLLIHVYRIFQCGSEKENHRIVKEARMEKIMGHAVFKVLRYIDNNLYQIESISEIAKELKYDQAYLSRIFHEKMGITLLRYIEEKKIKEAKKMMANGMSIGMIAAQLGYSSSQSFYKMFYRHEGCAPMTYLKNMIKQESVPNQK